jgi:hypothetical protein
VTNTTATPTIPITTTTNTTMHCKTLQYITNIYNIKINISQNTNSIYYIELHVSTYLRPSSGSQLVFTTHWGRNIFFVFGHWFNFYSFNNIMRWHQ